jgi:hypothetical protein
MATRREKIEAEVEFRAKGLSALKSKWLDFAGDLGEPVALLTAGAAKVEASAGYRLESQRGYASRGIKTKFEAQSVSLLCTSLSKALLCERPPEGVAVFVFDGAGG